MGDDSIPGTAGPLKGVAALFDDFERKTLFTKYLFFLGWVEILILAACWLHSLGDGRIDHLGPVESPFPWKIYFLVSFVAPIAITFLVGVVIVAFNQYFGGVEAIGHDPARAAAGVPQEEEGRLQKLNMMVSWLNRLPFLALLLLLAFAALFIFKLDGILSYIASVGERSVHFLLISAVVLVALGSVFALILIVLNYQLRKKSMEYRYRSEVAARYGLIILEDNTVLSRDGRLLVAGRRSRDATALLPAETADAPPPGASKARLPRPVDFEPT